MAGLPLSAADRTGDLALPDTKTARALVLEGKTKDMVLVLVLTFWGRRPDWSAA